MNTTSLILKFMVTTGLSVDMIFLFTSSNLYYVKQQCNTPSDQAYFPSSLLKHMVSQLSPRKKRPSKGRVAFNLALPPLLAACHYVIRGDK